MRATYSATDLKDLIERRHARFRLELEAIRARVAREKQAGLSGTPKPDAIERQRRARARRYREQMPGERRRRKPSRERKRARWASTARASVALAPPRRRLRLPPS